MHACPQCQSDWLVNNGSAAGKPKKLCKQCGYQFTRTTPRGKPLTTEINAVLLYLSGVSMNRIAFLKRLGLTPGSPVWTLLIGMDDRSEQTPGTDNTQDKG